MTKLSWPSLVENGIIEWERLSRLHHVERGLWERGERLVAGVDEAGRGPLAGPVVAAAVLLREELWIPGLDDSKKVSPVRREQLSLVIKKSCLSWGVGIAPVEVIERDNILQATFQAMSQALKRLKVQPQHILVDGKMTIPRLSIRQTAVVKGDARCASVAAASLIAKTTRDAIMTYYSIIYPHYHFERNKGYPTAEHLKALRFYGPSPLHRRNFHGVERG